jgi:chromosome segregation ATPase
MLLMTRNQHAIRLNNPQNAMNSFLQNLAEWMPAFFGAFHPVRRSHRKLQGRKRDIAIQLEISREDFETASALVDALSKRMANAESDGRHNRGQLGLMRGELQLAGRKAQAAFDRANRLQNDLDNLEAAQTGRERNDHESPISREDMEGLMRAIFVAEEKARREQETAAELNAAVYGEETEAMDLDILRKSVAPELFLDAIADCDSQESAER